MVVGLVVVGDERMLGLPLARLDASLTKKGRTGRTSLADDRDGLKRALKLNLGQEKYLGRVDSNSYIQCTIDGGGQHGP